MSNETIKAVSEIANMIPNMWNFCTGLRSDFINRNGFLYTCDFEARLNLDIIDSVNLNEVNGTVNTRAFLELVNSFETSATLAMIAGSNRLKYRRLVKLLEKHWEKPETALVAEGDNSSVNENVVNALDNFSFAVRKIEALKRITLIAANDAVFLKDFYLDKRLSNIKTALLGIRNCLKKVIKETE